MGRVCLTTTRAVIILVRLAIGSTRAGLRCHRTDPVRTLNTRPAVSGSFSLTAIRCAGRPIRQPYVGGGGVVGAGRTAVAGRGFSAAWPGEVDPARAQRRTASATTIVNSSATQTWRLTLGLRRGWLRVGLRNGLRGSCPGLPPAVAPRRFTHTPLFSSYWTPVVQTVLGLLGSSSALTLAGSARRLEKGSDRPDRHDRDDHRSDHAQTRHPVLDEVCGREVDHRCDEQQSQGDNNKPHVSMRPAEAEFACVSGPRA